MAEFIFDLQRFDDGDGDGGDTGSDTSTTGDTDTGSDTSNMSATAGTSGSSGSSSGSSSSGSSGSGGTGGTSGSSGSEAPSGRNAGLQSSNGSRWGYYTYDQWNAIVEDADTNYVAAVETDTVNYYVGTYGVADNILVSRYAINDIYNVDQLDTITFVDANTSDFPAYNYGSDYDATTYLGTGRYVGLSLNMGSTSDSGAGSRTVIHYSDVYETGLDYFSPTVAFANDSIVFSDTTRWISTDELALSEYFWSTCITQSGNANLPEVFTASRGFNNYITNVDAYDTILFSDASLFKDLLSANRVSNGVALNFLDGTSTIIEYSGMFSPTIQLASGETFVYNSEMDAWRTPEDAAADYAAYIVAAAAESAVDSGSGSSGSSSGSSGSGGSQYGVSGTSDIFSVDRLSDTAIYNTEYTDRIIFNDGTTLANVVEMTAAGDYLTLTFDTGAKLVVEYFDIFSPTFEFADGQNIGYDWSQEFWGLAKRYSADFDSNFIEISSGTNNLIYDAEWDDFICFTDTDESHITSADLNGSYINVKFDNGSQTSIKYLADSYGWSPHVYFGQDAQSGYFYSNGRWITFNYPYAYEKSLFGGSSADLWGDTFTGTAEADNLFVGTYANTVVDNVDSKDSVTFDAALSDIVATSVEGNTIAVAFTSGATAVIQTAGDSPTFNLTSGESFTYDRQASEWKTA